MKESAESAKFDAVVRKMMSVSHDEIKEREAEWKRNWNRAEANRSKSLWLLDPLCILLSYSIPPIHPNVRTNRQHCCNRNDYPA